MFDTTERFIAQMKLREQRKQRDQMRAAYQALYESFRAAGTDHLRLQVLYDGLKAITFANRPLHPQVDNLDVLFYDDRPDGSNDTLRFWLERLESELEAGLLRSEFVYIFGALLEEWTAQTSERQTDESEALRAEFIGKLTDKTPLDVQTQFIPLLDKLLEPASSDADRKFIDTDLRAPVSSAELKTVLEPLQNDIFRSGAFRSQARRFLANDGLIRELADALTIMIDQLDSWEWPSPVPVRMVQKRNRWRLFLDEDLPTACLLSILGLRWNAILRQLVDEQPSIAQKRRRLMERQAGFIRFNQRGHQQTSGLDLRAFVDIWTGEKYYADNGSNNLQFDRESLIIERSSSYDYLRDVSQFDRYSGRESVGGMETALKLIHAEISLARAAYPDTPLYVVKVDLKDFYASIPHEVILTLLSRLGLSEGHLNFFRRLLQIPIDHNGQITPTTQGIPNARVYSNVLADLLLDLLDRHVQDSAPVQVLRLVDDMIILAASPDNALKAWNAVQDFCAATGLQVNEAKCGSVAIGGTGPAGLPSGLPTWLMLTLHEDGEWRVNTAAFEAYTEQVRRRANASLSVFSLVELYNSELLYLIHELAITMPLGDVHRQSINAAISRWQANFSAQGQDIVSLLKTLIAERFGSGKTAPQIPEAWLYWPITAGGLGLTQAAILVAGYAEAHKQIRQPKPPTSRPADWQIKKNEWSQYYAPLHADLGLLTPKQNQVMETLVKDFIDRGSTITSGKQKGLSSYWRWILYTYGPQILAHFGTFRFLITELVPLQLIMQQRVGDTSGETESP